MKNNNDAIKRENKKALGKFAVILAVCLVGGALLGLALVRLGLENFGDTLDAAGLFFATRAAFWLLLALPILELAVCLPIYFGAKKQLSAWDGEDETTGGEVEVKLSVCMWMTGIALIFDFFLAAAQFSGFVTMVGNPTQITPVRFFGGLALFIVTGAVSTVLQQKVVDATKQLNPEKHGSVYDTKFQKKWYECCDEAERLVVGQCALQAYKAMTYTCLALWAVFSLGGMFFNWGFLPAMAVCIVWGVGQSVYCWSCLKQSKPGTAL